MENNGNGGFVWNLLDVLILSCSMTRVYGYVPHTKQPSVWSSDELLKFSLIPSLLPDLFPSIPIVTQQDILEATDILKFYSKLTIDCISGCITRQNRAVYRMIQTQQVHEDDIPYIARLPSRYQKELALQTLKLTLKQTSKVPIAHEGQTVLLTIKYVNVYYSRKIARFVHEAVTTVSNSFVTFFSTEKVGYEGTTQTILAVVSKNSTHKPTKATVSKLCKVTPLKRK